MGFKAFYVKSSAFTVTLHCLPVSLKSFEGGFIINKFSRKNISNLLKYVFGEKVENEIALYFAA